MTNALNIEEVVEARIVDKNKKSLDNFPTAKSLAVRTLPLILLPLSKKKVERTSSRSQLPWEKSSKRRN